ncbi:cyclopropane-fatty-acyl-phospholipid synthase [Pilatotrama ljubarskyi]|nr:cyclopropane-fatty-acyl-phospholipid synthase [Pilatotrama ljubarskyi]
MTPSPLHPSTLRSAVLSAGLLPETVTGLLRVYGRSRIFDVLSRGILSGGLIIEDDDGVYKFGNTAGKKASSVVTIRVRRPSMWTRILMSNDLGVAEAFMHGDFDVSDLKGLLNLWLDNRTTLAGLSNPVSSFCARYSAIAINTFGRQTLGMSKWNVEVAYDTSNMFFQCFLSKEMMYSCAIWSDEEGGVRGDLTDGPRPGDLEAAQLRKIRTILTKARVHPGDRLLEIGTGWGGMAAAKLGCIVDTVTLSREQQAMAQQRAREAGVADRVRVHVCDYRELPPSFEHSFDAVVSCEMIEAVGPRHLHTFLRVLDWALKPDRATVVITATSQPEHRWSEYQPDDFARHYHWPNTHLPSPLSLPNAVQAAVPGKFVLHHLEDHGMHYPRTLREWGRRLEKNFKGDVVAELQEKYPELREEAALESFKRKWQYMFTYAEVGYARAYTNLNCWTFTRPENVAVLCS